MFRLLKVDPEHPDMPLRDPKTGFCVLAAVDEKGLAANMIDNSNPVSRFDGYSDPSATSKKVLRDVFVKGDAYFNSGDLLSRDAFGFFFWADRVGDTFRWKGENVATTEVRVTEKKKNKPTFVKYRWGGMLYVVPVRWSMY
jgi:acyl-CoA synthetase (AMP-forming)/AMP-acid ligase II